MAEQQNIIEIKTENLITEAEKLKKDGYRLVQMCAVRVEGGFEMTYSFAREYEFVCLRLILKENDEVESISHIFPPIFLYENETKELFGINIKDISLDYNGKFYRINSETPFKSCSLGIKK